MFVHSYAWHLTPVILSASKPSQSKPIDLQPCRVLVTLLNMMMFARKYLKAGQGKGGHLSRLGEIVSYTEKPQTNLEKKMHSTKPLMF